MKKFASLLLMATAVIAESQLSDQKTMPTAKSGDIESVGTVEEEYRKDGEEEAVYIFMDWRTGGAKFDDDYWVQNYAQWPDPSKPGTYMGFTCNAAYKRKNNDYSRDVAIENFYGSASLADTKKTNWQGYGIPSALQIFQAPEKEDDEQLYKDTFKTEWDSSEDESFQTCGAGGLLWKTVDGEAPDDDIKSLNEQYWTLKEGPAIRVESGFRIWKKKSDGTPWKTGSAQEFSYSLADFDDVKKPKPAIIMPSQDELDADLQDTGAVALATATASALVALMLM